MTRKLVGWFAVVAGVLLGVHMGYRIRDLLRAGGLTAVQYVQTAMLAVLMLAGVALVVFGLRRLRRPETEEK